MWEAIRRYYLTKHRLRTSMRELARNGYNSVQLHGNVTLMQKLHTRLFGH